MILSQGGEQSKSHTQNLLILQVKPLTRGLHVLNYKKIVMKKEWSNKLLSNVKTNNTMLLQNFALKDKHY